MCSQGAGELALAGAWRAVQQHVGARSVSARGAQQVGDALNRRLQMPVVGQLERPGFGALEQAAEEAFVQRPILEQLAGVVGRFQALGGIAAVHEAGVQQSAGQQRATWPDGLAQPGRREFQRIAEQAQKAAAGAGPALGAGLDRVDQRTVVVQDADEPHHAQLVARQAEDAGQFLDEGQGERRGHGARARQQLFDLGARGRRVGRCLAHAERQQALRDGRQDVVLLD